MRLYFDICCLKRPFDDQSQGRIAVETAAVLALLRECEEGKHHSLRSSAHDLENALNSNPRRAAAVQLWLNQHGPTPVHANALRPRVETLRAAGLSGFDALHLAWAENLRAECFLTTDDRFISRATRLTPPLALRIMNPVQFVESGMT